MAGQQKKSLNAVSAWWYFFTAATVLAVGNTTPDLLPATMSAVCAFFVVVTLYAIMHHFMVWCYPFIAVASDPTGRGRIIPTTMSMVAQAGPISVGPVSGSAGSGIPVWAIASEHTTSCDSVFRTTRRLPQWLQPQPKSTQNQRSPNSATTVVAGYIVRRWLRSIHTFSALLIIPFQLIFVFRTYCLTSTMILRL